jgi:hypothetical protein
VTNVERAQTHGNPASNCGKRPSASIERLAALISLSALNASLRSTVIAHEFHGASLPLIVATKRCTPCFSG